MIRINLLSDREAIRKETSRQEISVFALSVLLFAVILGGVHFSMTQKKKGVEKRIVEAEQTLKDLDKQVGKVEDFKTVKKELEKKLEIIDKLQLGKMWAVRIFDDISNTISEKMWLDNLKMTGPSLAMQGYAIDNETIARFMSEMEHSDSFSSVNLGLTEQKEVGGIGLKYFTMVSTANLSAKKHGGSAVSGEDPKGGSSK